ncbi:MAG: hypothetical protein K5872_00320 [Rhizobiaceae bacterium]|nr:hypothetical protein [Rhizobiaceae bacterium]MCV0404651.1 hypothetical protein [Rhizobiaceae bacterium]
MTILDRLMLSAAVVMAVLPIREALAADYDPPIYIEDAPEYVPVEIGSGWYLRGDIGYNFNARHATDSYRDPATMISYETNFRDALTGGVGFGYRFTDYIRADATLDRIFGSDFASRALIAPEGPCLGYGQFIDPDTGVSFLAPDAIDNCLSEDSASYNAWLLMGNVYADLGTYAGFTPFIGAGAGVARVSWSEEIDSITCVPQAPEVRLEGCSASGSLNQPPPNTIYTEPGINNSGVDYRFAWSLTAGVSYLLNPNLSLDTSYRYIQVGGSDQAIVYNNTPGSSMAADGFGVHQVKVGLRYQLW